jgi:hypothetical protein
MQWTHSFSHVPRRRSHRSRYSSIQPLGNSDDYGAYTVTVLHSRLAVYTLSGLHV